ncbi:WecB/TagA/CpsF family glycosyltransferase [Microbulbifer agarilyticus]|uniref:WecB/TagA/CpsF family glycosyltransferase n=1 Tax=Microbulbifer agarilyticus TaxID=260552 RepID=UPI001CD5545F|nr:WecB/TagA/CpsF family glycosyltransferase [Microbulbifer agarilyticus]MCA0893639.1 WecB/TagA/CpsF family glycosyltransferase [Microbulbifer agarilyticus]
MPHIHSVDIGLCRIDTASMDIAIEYIRQMQRKKHAGYIVTPNVDHLARLARKDDTGSLQHIYRNASLSLCDSRILEALLNRHGTKIPQVVTGSDLTRRLFESELNSKDRIYILGGEDDVINIVRDRFPYLGITHHNPTMGFINKSDEVKKVIDNILGAQPDFVFLAVGSPQQEKLALMLKQQARFHGIALCIGASILFLADKEKRAPKWMQHSRLEWLYRLLQNPTRLTKRYIQNALVLPTINRILAQSVAEPAAN